MRSLGLGLGFNRHRILGGVVPLLDTYTGASAAYSLRKLSSSTTNVVRVRRSSNDDEQDFTASEVSGGALATFVGAGNDGFVTTWYDQVPFEEVTGTELVTQFDGVADGTDVTTLTNWSAYGTPTSRNVVNEALVIVASGGNQGAKYTATTTTGNKYLFTCDVSGDLGAGALYFPATSDGAQNVSTADGSVRFFFEASVASTDILFRANSNGAGTTTYSNISLKEVDRIPNDATQTSASQQPKIVDSGSLILDNGKPIIQNLSAAGLQVDAALTNTSPVTQFSVAKIEGTRGIFSTYRTTGDRFVLAAESGSTNTSVFSDTPTSIFQDGSSYTVTNRGTLYNDSTSQSLFTIYWSSPNYQEFDKIGFTSGFWQMWSTQELIIYNSDQTSNRAAIEDNINSYYSIYT